MEYRSLGRTGVQVSPLCLGTMTFGDQTEEAEALAIVDCALDAGINFIDTANVYSRGGSEEIVGRALAREGKRSRVVLATKVQGQMADGDPNASGLSRRHIIEQCEASLRRLQTDYIDLYQTHVASEEIPVDETLRALDDLVCSGKVRYIGCSNIGSWQVLEALWAARELKLNRYVSVQPAYNMLDRYFERELIPMAETYGLAVLPWSPLAAGFLSGKYKREEEHGAETRLGDPKTFVFFQELAFSDAAYQVVDVLREISDEKGCTPAQLSLAWCMNQPGVTSPIVGARTARQLEDSLGALSVTITGEDEQRIDAVAAPGCATVSFSEWKKPLRFGPHRHSWI